MWIKNRIDAEYKKHYRVTGGCDWSRIAEAKINTVLNDKVEKLKEDESDRIALMKILKLSCKDNDMIEKKEAHKMFIEILEKRKEIIDKIMGSFNRKDYKVNKVNNLNNHSPQELNSNSNRMSNTKLGDISILNLIKNKKLKKIAKKVLDEDNHSPLWAQNVPCRTKINWKNNHAQDICECGHEKDYHVLGEGGCFYPPEMIVDFSEASCPCKKFKAQEKEVGE